MIYKKKNFNKLLAYSIICFSQATYSNQDEMFNMSIEDLLNVEVISVAKKAKSLNDSPAAIYVITHDDIKRIGATSIPEALRLAPGLDVSRIDSNKWAVTIRGFNGLYANKLLVLIDGRNVYTRSFSGINWDDLDTVLEDIERIEVIRGPGATLWGANAVNGVINIITKSSSKTQGGLLVAGGGTEEQGFGTLRYGAELNENTTARAYIKGFTRNNNHHETGDKAQDNWDKEQIGFKIDSQPTHQDTLVIQGDIYRGSTHHNETAPLQSSPYFINHTESLNSFGGNLLVHHQHTFSSTSDYSLQLYYDFYSREASPGEENKHTIDVDFNHSFSWLNWNDVIWGAGYRYNNNNIRPSSSLYSLVDSPNHTKNDQLFSAFIQDEITLIENSLWLTLGSKFEYNDYSGFEVQPTARIMWIPHAKHRLWAAVSRAVRTPSRAESDVKALLAVVPPNQSSMPTIHLFSQGDDQFSSEQVISYELGYRTTMINNVSIDLTAFYNNYNQLRSSYLSTPSYNAAQGTLQISNLFENTQSAHTYGFEISTVWQMLEWWHWDANYSLLKTEFKHKQLSPEVKSPQQRVSLRSSLSLWQDINLDFLFRYVDSNQVSSLQGGRMINDYTSLDIRLAWQPINTLELSLTGQNLLADHHLEYIHETYTSPTEIDRGIYGKLVWNF